MLRCLLIAAAAFAVGWCMYNSDPVHWNRHPYLVKVLVRNRELKNISTCSGTLISRSAVLTSPKCFQDARDNTEAQVIITLQGTMKTVRKSMLDVRIDGQVAIMRIDSFHEKHLCEKPPHPSRFVRLNMKSSMVDVPFRSIKTSDLEEKRCRVIGFKTTDNVDTFHSSRSTQVLDLEVQKQNDNYVFSEVNGNSTGSACWDDLGAPLECALNEENVYIQVGYLHSIYGRAVDVNDLTNATCADVQTMEFFVFADDSLAHSIEEVDKVGVFDVHDKCF